MEGAEELGTAGMDSGTGGLQPKAIGEYFQGGSAGGSIIRFGDVGADPPHRMGPGKLPAQGRQADNVGAAEATVGWGWE